MGTSKQQKRLPNGTGGPTCTRTLRPGSNLALFARGLIKPRLQKKEMAPIIATCPFQIMGMDIMVIPPPMSENGNSCIVLFTDYYTKWVEAFALPDSEATTVA